MKGSLLRANSVNRLNTGEKINSRKRYIGFAEKVCLVDHYSRIKKLYTEHGDSGVKVYVLQVLAEVDKRIKNHNMKQDPKNPQEEPLGDTPLAEQIEEGDVDDEFASDDLYLEDEEEDYEDEEELGGEA